MWPRVWYTAECSTLQKVSEPKLYWFSSLTKWQYISCIKQFRSTLQCYISVLNILSNYLTFTGAYFKYLYKCSSTHKLPMVRWSVHEEGTIGRRVCHLVIINFTIINHNRHNRHHHHFKVHRNYHRHDYHLPREKACDWKSLEPRLGPLGKPSPPVDDLENYDDDDEHEN